MSCKALMRYLLSKCLTAAGGMKEVKAIQLVRNLLLRPSLDRKLQAGTCLSLSLSSSSWGLSGDAYSRIKVPCWRPGCQEALEGRTQTRRGESPTSSFW